MSNTTGRRAGLIAGVLFLICLLSLVLAMLAGGLVASQRYGGVGPAYATINSQIWFPVSQTAYVPISQTDQANMYLSATVGAPATQTADVIWRQTATMGTYPAMTAQAQWDQTLTAGVPATATANAAATQNAP